VLLDHRDQLEQINHTQTRPAGRRHHKRVKGRQARPPRIHATELPRVVVVVHTVLTPGQAPVHQRELAPVKRMEGVGDTEELRPIGQIACS
jgi:hypothetical protein